MGKTIPGIPVKAPADTSHLRWAESLRRDPELWQDFKDFLKGLDKGLEQEYALANEHGEFLRIQASRRFAQQLLFLVTADEREEDAYARRPG